MSSNSLPYRLGRHWKITVPIGIALAFLLLLLLAAANRQEVAYHSAQALQQTSAAPNSGSLGNEHWIIVVIVIGMYFLPSIIGRRKRNFTAILWLNILTGWTFVGWIVALVWALTKEPLPAN